LREMLGEHVAQMNTRDIGLVLNLPTVEKHAFLFPQLVTGRRSWKPMGAGQLQPRSERCQFLGPQ